MTNIRSTESKEHIWVFSMIGDDRFIAWLYANCSAGSYLNRPTWLGDIIVYHTI
jgi:hypothetical protein